MNSGFWKNLNKPVMVLAPMADVTDAAFRRIIAKYGRPDATWTEFVSADGLFLGPAKEITEPMIRGELSREEFFKRAREGGKGTAIILDLMYDESERPIVAQFFTSKPELMKKAAELAVVLGFDGIDINMGCPDDSINRQGAGAALIKTPELAQAVIRAAKEGAAKGNASIPVSVKTRAGYNQEILETWVPMLLEEEPAVLTMHARIRKDMSKVPARWDLVKRTREIRDAMGKETLIFGNGDAPDLLDARKKAEEAGADGVMLGRAIFGNPWLFANLAHAKRGSQIERPVPISQDGAEMDGSQPSEINLEKASQSRNRADRHEHDAETSSREIDAGLLYIPTTEEKLRVCVEHTKLFEELLGKHKNFSIMKKHYKAYIAGFNGAADLRGELMQTNTAGEIEEIINKFLKGTQKTAS
ncbi:MAG TPA: tRNA-dihydrouridine synthase family protein [Candidatus Paceibacterota bacterium]|jgi:tRNA-dihydrouridine synthase|nr:tRNA-dihydrouridine synthase family protein [Candidatus Paceibacterota bacterium]